MLAKEIEYLDYNNNPRKEVFLFNLTKAEVTEMELSTDGGLVKKIEAIVAAQNGAEIVKLFKDIIFKSYGEKSPDGKHFVKSDAISTAFSQTEAYSILFMELATNAGAAADFVNAIVPVDKDIDKDKKAVG
jgi:hypothetical protein